tara:strand:- start:4283 stop:5038 length:756 start_codon:yes stop_codon:yes gene_type:complete
MRDYSEIYDKGDLGLWVDITTYCNASCPQCHRTNPDGLGKANWLPLLQWDIKTFKKYITREVLNSCDNLEFCGTWGDPFMNKDIWKICEYIIKESKAKIKCNTNGSFRNPDWWWDLGVLCGDRLTCYFDIDGIDQETHSKYRRGTDLELIKENLVSLAATKAYVKIFTVLFKHNQDQLADIMELGKECGAESIYVVPSDRFHWRVTPWTFINEDGEEEDLHKSDWDQREFQRTFKLNRRNIERVREYASQR